MGTGAVNLQVQSRVFRQPFAVNYDFPVHFTRGLFSLCNPALAAVIEPSDVASPKLLVFIESQLARVIPELSASVTAYALAHGLRMPSAPLELPGAEAVKATRAGCEFVLKAIDEHRIDRHSYVMAIGGGAFLDAVGFAAATAHRGVRLIRVPTTVLAQADSAIGVKCAINYFGKKNWLGSFCPPYAVLNDFDFLDTLSERDWRAGIVEAVKVAAIRDPDFFAQLEADAPALCARDKAAMERTVVGSAERHLRHIASGDAFEMGSARPLDFGHWLAHKLEAMSKYRLRHGEAVAIGIAHDCEYAMRDGRLSETVCARVINLLLALGCDLWAPELSLRASKKQGGKRLLLAGLEEFREHLGGRLTVTLLDAIGHGVEVHDLDEAVIEQALGALEDRAGSRGRGSRQSA